MNRNLLVITPSFPNKDNSFVADIFVKHQLEALKSYFDEITVIAPVLSSLGYLPKDRYCINYQVDNIHVFFPRCFYIPIFYFDKILLDNRLGVVQRLIENKKIQFDLIHAHFTWPSGYIAVKLKENFHVPVVITIHEDPLWLKNEILMNNLLFNDTWKNADALIRVNSTEVNILKNYNPNSFFVPNGYSSKIQLMDQDMCRKKLNLPIEKKIILNVGNLESIKGQSDLITAICRILKKRNDICCYIIGDGPERKRLQKKIIRLNLQNFIFLKKGVPHYEIPIWMNASNLFVLTSLEESFGIVQIEAMACGKPVIATKTIGSKEILLSEDYGLLTEIGNPENLAKTILIALDRTWNSENIRTYANHYSWDVIKDEILKIYSKINRNNPPI